MTKICFREISNPRKGDGWQCNDIKCDKCGTITNAYVSIIITADYWKILHSIVLCKGCLLKGVDLIDETVIRQCI